MVIRNNFHELIRICCIFKGGFFGIGCIGYYCVLMMSHFLSEKTGCLIFDDNNAWVRFQSSIFDMMHVLFAKISNSDDYTLILVYDMCEVLWLIGSQV